jgi:hypothetical protein
MNTVTPPNLSIVEKAFVLHPEADKEDARIAYMIDAGMSADAAAKAESDYWSDNQD